MNRIVFLRSNSVNPDSRIEKETNALKGAGHDVTILCWDRSNSKTQEPDYLHQSNGDIMIIRFGIPAEYGAGMSSLFPFLVFQIRMALWLVLHRKSFEVIHACDYDTAFTGYLISRVLRKKLVFDIFDFLFFKPSGKLSFFKQLIKTMQLKVVDEADHTIICTEKRIEQIAGSTPKNITIIHNSPPPINQKNLQVDLNSSKTKIVYVGILQDLRFLKEMAEVIQQMADVELHIGGFGKYESYFRDLSNQSDSIIYYGKLSYAETLALENSCDVMTAIYDPAYDNHYFAAPNKFYEALMLGKPLIMIQGTGMSEIVLNNDFGEVVDYTKDSLKKGIIRLIQRKSEWPEIGNRMNDMYQKQFSWSEMEKRLIHLYEGLEPEHFFSEGRQNVRR